MTGLIISISLIVIIFIYALGNTKIKKLEEKLYYERQENYRLYQRLHDKQLDDYITQELSQNK